MRKLRQILQWIRRELFFDLNRVYKNDIRIPPKNRHTRRLQAKEDKCWYWNFFHGRDWYKWRDYAGAYDSLISAKIKELIKKNTERNEKKKNIHINSNIGSRP